MKETVYHYSKLRDWRDIAHPLSQQKGLRPGLRLGKEYEPAVERGALFALLSPRPVEWTDNQDFPDGPRPWEYLSQTVGKLLLEVDVDPDQTHVIDWGHREGLLRQPVSELTVPDRFAHRSRLAAERAYVESAVTLSDYLSGGQMYSLPEVIIEQTIGLDDIRVSADQSLLDEHLQEGHPKWNGGDLFMMDFVPGLENLRAKYTAAVA